MTTSDAGLAKTSSVLMFVAGYESISSPVRVKSRLKYQELTEKHTRLWILVDQLLPSHSSLSNEQLEGYMFPVEMMMIWKESRLFDASKSA